MTQYLGQIGTPSGASLITKAVTDPIIQKLQQQQALKQQMAQAMINSGQYQPVMGGPQPNMMQKLLGSGPQLGQPNMNIGGQNFQYQSPDVKMANLQKQLQMIQGLGGQDGQTQGTQGPQLGNLPNSLPNYQVSAGDIDMNKGTVSPKVSMTTPLQQAEYQSKLLDIQKKQGEAKQQEEQQKNQVDLSKNSEDIREEMKKRNPGLYNFGEAINRGDMSLKDIPAYGKNAQNKLIIDQYMASAYPGVNLELRRKVKQDYSPGGPIGKQLTSAGTIVQHMYELKKTIKDLNAQGFKPWNQLLQTGSRATGLGAASAINKYDLLKNLLSSEYETYLRNGGSAESGIERIIHTMDEANPTEVQEQVLDEGANAMAGRLGNYVSGWYDQFNQLGDPKIPSTILNTKTRYALQKMGMNDVIKGVESPQGLAGVEEQKKSNQSIDYKSKYGLD